MNYNKESIFIPIGEDCFSTIFLRDHGLRKFSTIFDWVVLSPISILNLFKNDFKDFLLKKNLKVIKKSDRIFKHAELEVMETKYNIFIPHHFNNLDTNYKEVYDKFIKRIERLNNILLNNKEINFMYKEINKHELIHFSNDLHSDFGKNNMQLIEKELKELIKNKYNCNVNFIYLEAQINKNPNAILPENKYTWSYPKDNLIL